MGKCYKEEKENKIFTASTKWRMSKMKPSLMPKIGYQVNQTIQKWDEDEELKGKEDYFYWSYLNTYSIAN